MTTTADTVQAFNQAVCSEVERAIVGKRDTIEKVMAAILSNGHVLFEDYPGLGKTLLAKSLAAALGLQFKRIQFTPDLLPGDITGGYIFDREKNSFTLRPGPVFANLVLADEINRASPKTQSALLEAMQEHQVTIEGETMRLPSPFIVLATQNPIEYEGTFPLPEAQLDRFMIKIAIGYPTTEQEQEILARREERKQDDVPIAEVVDSERLLQAQTSIENVHIDVDLMKYITALVAGTRSHASVVVGSSPRGSLALLKLSRAHAAQQGRNYVLPDDVKDFVPLALGHRMLLAPDLWMKKRAAADIVTGLLQSIPVPVLAGKQS